MYLTSETKKGLFKKFGNGASDTGSPESQVALFTHRIQHLSVHLETYRKDRATQFSLQKLVGQRKKLLSYLKDSDIERYRDIIKKLGIRK
jgi:small subunit ribosomal protein S15